MCAHPNSGTFDPYKIAEGSVIVPGDLQRQADGSVLMHEMAAIPIGCDAMKATATWYGAGGAKTTVVSDYITGVLSTTHAAAIQSAFADQTDATKPLTLPAIETNCRWSFLVSKQYQILLLNLPTL